MEYIFVKKLRPEDSVRNPITGKKILECGQLVPKDRYWLSKVEAGILEVLPINGVPKEESAQKKRKKANNQL